MTYDELLQEAQEKGIKVLELPLKGSDGRIYGNRIAIRKGLPEAKKKCVLAEELGHYNTIANQRIIDQSNVTNVKLEILGRKETYDRLVSLNSLIESFTVGCRTYYDVANYLEITEELLREAIKYYKRKYGVCTKVDNYVLCFEPTLSIMEIWGE